MVRCSSSMRARGGVLALNAGALTWIYFKLITPWDGPHVLRLCVEACTSSSPGHYDGGIPTPFTHLDRGDAATVLGVFILVNMQYLSACMRFNDWGSTRKSLLRNHPDWLTAFERRLRSMLVAASVLFTHKVTLL